MIQLDLGCGDTPRRDELASACFGVDIHPNDNHTIKQADLAIEAIPYADDWFDLVTAYDFMEHIPPMLYVNNYERLGEYEKSTPTRRNCMIELFNEIYRVLKPNGEFFMASPIVGSVEYYRDPTHVFPWTEQTIHYFSGDYYGMHDLYSHTSKFELVDKQVIDGWRLELRLRAIKPCVPPFEVGGMT